MKPTFFDDRIQADLLPDVIRLQPNLYAARFFLIKLIPAFYLLEEARLAGIIKPGSVVIKSTSGTFGLGLALVCRLYGYHFIMVSDPVISETFQRRIEDLGATVEIVPKPAPEGGFQASRLERLHELRTRYPGAFWPCQYDNPQMPRTYQSVSQFLVSAIGKINCLVGPVGSGASMCGIGTFLQEQLPELRVIGVDTFGSVLFGQSDQHRLLRGLGNSIIPANLNHSLFDEVHWVTAAEGFRSVRILLGETGLYQGPTSGAAYMVARWWAARNPEANVVVLLPDEGYRYESQVYNDGWLKANNIYVTSVPGNPVLLQHPKENSNQWSYTIWDHRTLAGATGLE